MLVALDDIKNYLGIPLIDPAYDVFLTEQEAMISDIIERYCGRKFLQANYVQTFYKSDYANMSDRDYLYLMHYPSVTINSVTEIETDNDGNETPVILTASQYRPMTTSGKISKISSGVVRGWFNNMASDSKVEVDYIAGFLQADIPQPIRFTILSICEENYNKKKTGVSLNFGSDVQRMSVPGVFSIDFDYTLTKNDRKSKYGMLLGDYANMIDSFRSERALVGKIKENYVA